MFLFVGLLLFKQHWEAKPKNYVVGEDVSKKEDSKDFESSQSVLIENQRAVNTRKEALRPAEKPENNSPSTPVEVAVALDSSAKSNKLFPEKTEYKEMFPGLETYKWLFGANGANGVIGIRLKYGNPTLIRVLT